MCLEVFFIYCWVNQFTIYHSIIHSASTLLESPYWYWVEPPFALKIASVLFFSSLSFYKMLEKLLWFGWTKKCQENIHHTISLPPPAWTVDTRHVGSMDSCCWHQVLIRSPTYQKPILIRPCLTLSKSLTSHFSPILMYAVNITCTS